MSSQNDLVVNNMGFVHWVAKKYMKYLEYDELISAGYWGLVQAAQRYNERKGRFTTYAYWWVRKEMLEAIRNMSPVYIPSHRAADLRPTQLVFDADDIWWSRLTDQGHLAVAVLEMLDEQRQLHDSLDCLDDRQKEVIKWRFGLEGREPETLEEVGRRFDLSRERIRQIEGQALGKLRDELP